MHPNRSLDKLFALGVFICAAVLTCLMWPEYLVQAPFILFFVAVALNATRCGMPAGLLTGVSGAFIVLMVTQSHVNSITLTPYILYTLATAIVSFHLGKKHKIEAELRSEIEVRRRVEENLKSQYKLSDEVHSRLSAIVASSADAIISESLDGTIITWNEGAQRIFGYSPEEALGRPISFLTPVDRLDEPTYLLDSVRSGKALNQAETQRVHKSGRIIHVSLSISPVRDSTGAIIGISKIARDISTRKRAQERERFLIDASDLLGGSLEYEATLKQLAQLTIPFLADWCTIFVKDETGQPKRIAIAHTDEKALKAAEAFKAQYPFDSIGPPDLQKIIQNGEAEIFPEVHDDHLRRFAHDENYFLFLKDLNIRSLMIVPLHAHGKTFGAITFASTSRERRYGHADFHFAKEIGRRAGLAIENSRLYLEASRAVARYETELVERERIEQELRRAKEAADQSSRAKTAFLANMSHEIRTPLGAILGFSELLANADQSSMDRQESLEVIHRNGQLLSNIINDILDLTKVEAGHLEIERLTVPLHTLFEETKSSLSLLASEKGIGLTLTFADNLPSNIETDPLRLKQILINIIGNAVKFTERGHVTVNISVEARSGQNDLLKIEVNDTGKGLSSDEVEKLFRAFTQADASTTRKYGGTGLGLILSRQLSRALGGDVDLVKSRPGQGSTFLISIDAGTVQQECARIGASSISGRGLPDKAIASNAKPLEGLRVLVVEDARDNQLLMSRILKLEGAIFDIAENGQVGVYKALSDNFDIVLMDVQMPVMDGFEAMLELRGLGYHKPIVALTAHAMREERERCLNQGFDDHMSKPVDRNKLRGLLLYYWKKEVIDLSALTLESNSEKISPHLIFPHTEHSS